MGKTLGVLLLLCAPVCSVFADDPVFSGRLEKIAAESITIRLADRRAIEAKLPSAGSLTAQKIAARYKFGDEVEIKCRRIPPAWDENSAHFQFLELEKLQFIRMASAGQLWGMRELPAWREEANLLDRPAIPESGGDAPPVKSKTAPRETDEKALDKLEHAREVNLESAAHLPNFVADETAKRYTSDTTSLRWRYADTIEDEVTFRGNRVQRQQIRRNGRKWDRPFQALPGFKWGGGFGGELQPLFDIQCPTRIDYDSVASAGGQQRLKYRFESPPDGCFSDFYVEYQRYNPARAGYFLIDDRSDYVVYLNEVASGFPARFDFVRREEEVSWESVQIGDAPHLLPVTANFVVEFSSGKRWRIEVQYKNHRHFESSTNVTFH